jgi:hypothetical protein
VWQRGPWLLVDRVTGHVTALKLPDYDPGASQVIWFRDYGAYCGVTASGKSLYAVVAQVGARKAVLRKKLAAFDPENHPDPVCGPTEWQREPLRITFHPAALTLFPDLRCWWRTRTTRMRRRQQRRQSHRLPSRNSKAARAEPELLCPDEFHAEPTLPDGSVDLSVAVSGTIDSGSAIAGGCGAGRRFNACCSPCQNSRTPRP